MNSKEFTPSEDMKSAARGCFLAMAYTGTVRPIVEGYQHDILSEYQFRTDVEQYDGKRVYPDKVVLNPDHTYMLTEDDFAFYLAECRTAQSAAGLKTESRDHCPLLVAESIQRDAEHLLIDAMEPLTGINFNTILGSRNFIDHLKKYIDLSLKLLAPFVDAKEIL